MTKPFHLAWFTNFTPGDWTAPFSHGGSPWDGKFFVEMAQAMERACFDDTEVCEGLVPALQRRGLARTEYKGGTLREVLREF